MLRPGLTSTPCGPIIFLCKAAETGMWTVPARTTRDARTGIRSPVLDHEFMIRTTLLAVLSGLLLFGCCRIHSDGGPVKAVPTEPPVSVRVSVSESRLAGDPIATFADFYIKNNGTTPIGLTRWENWGGEPPLALSCYEDHSMARPTGRTEAGILRWPEWPPPGDRDAKHLARYTSGVAGSWEGHTDIIPPDGGFVAFRGTAQPLL